MTARRVALVALVVVAVGAITLWRSGDPIPAPTAQRFVPEPARKVAEVSVSEAAAFEAAGQVKRELCAALEGGPLDELLAPGFRMKRPFVQHHWTLTAEGARHEERVAAPDGPDDEAFAALLTGLVKPMDRIERCGLHNDRFLLDDSEGWAWARLSFDAAGPSGSESRLQHHASMAAALSRSGERWHLARLEVLDLESHAFSAARFRDVSALTGVGLFRSEQKAASLLDRLGNINVTNNGGLTILDFDRDGDEDLLVYNVHSLIDLFLNDGRGGFNRVAAEALPPASQAAMFYLYLDLDGDGREELVGSEPVTCGTGRDRIPIYRVQGGRFAEVDARLEVDYGCDDRFAHIAPHDLDGDGRLDLFFSNYGLAKRDVDLNHSDAVDGGRNRFFRNLGGLRFEDATEAVGVDGSTRRTLLGHWWDFTGDGRDDLLLINDFADNEIYLGTPEGTLAKGRFSPFTEAGFSMGVSIADFDGDLDFDVFVSNMFSNAGRRILSITEELDEAQHARLLRMASGNALYEEVAPGRYRDVAAERGVENAKWAWGSVAFDYDNDGDRDLWVTNGFASSSDPGSKRAPDN